MMRRRPRLVGLLWHWHRRLGVLAAFFVLVLSTTGIVLNHSSEWGLDRSFVDWPWLSRAYGDDATDLPAFQLGEHWISRAANGRVYLDAVDVARCSGKLVGAVESGDLLFAACAEELLLISGSGELVESITASTGLPVPLQSVGLIDSQVALQVGGIWWLADLDQMDFSHRAPAGGAVVRQLVPDRLPEDIRNRIPVPDQWLSWERLLLDLHSGRVFGRIGVFWVDAVAVLVGSLAISGTAMWWLHRRRKQGRSGHSGD
jgi:hypothetical protein